MQWLLRHLRSVFAHLRRPTLHAARLASRIHRTTMFSFDLVVWSRLVAHRRGPIPLELPRALVEKKGIRFTPPVLHVSGPTDFAVTWEEGFTAVNANLFLNLQNPDLLSQCRYAHPAPAFKGVYLWDSAFIAQVWKWWDAQTAADVLQAVLDLRDGDRLQHLVSDLANSAFTQPPLVAWSLSELHRSTAPEDREALDLERSFQILSRYNAWLYRERRHESGLFFWQHAYESGVENSPRFGSRDESDLVDTRTLAAPDFCACVVLQNEALAEMAGTLGKDREARRFREQAETLAALVNERLWDDKDRFYYDRTFETGEFVRTRTVTGLFPLWAGIANRDQALALRNTVLDPNGFNTPMPLPSVARGDPEFELDMWRGPVWLNTAYGAVLGLQRYGFLREAADLAWRLCHGVYATHATTRRVHEFYDPEEFHIGRLNRKRGNRWKRLTLGSKPRPEFLGWTGLVNTLAIETLIGFHREPDGTLALRPRLPPQAAGIGFSLRLPAEDVSLHIDALDYQGTTQGTLRRHRDMRPFRARFDENVPLP